MPSDHSSASEAELQELAALYAKVSKPTDDGRYPYWTQEERDRVMALIRKQRPSIRFAPSTEEMARRFGHRSKR